MEDKLSFRVISTCAIEPRIVWSNDGTRFLGSPNAFMSGVCRLARNLLDEKRSEYPGFRIPYTNLENLVLLKEGWERMIFLHGIQVAKFVQSEEQMSNHAPLGELIALRSEETLREIHANGLVERLAVTIWGIGSHGDLSFYITEPDTTTTGMPQINLLKEFYGADSLRH